MHSLSECYKNNKQFANRTTNWIGNHTDIYWVGAFSVTYDQLDLVSSPNGSCIAVNITDRQLTPALVQCDNLLPAVCVKHSDTTRVSTEPNIINTQSIVTNGGDTITQYSVTDLSLTKDSDPLTTRSGRMIPSSGQTATQNHEATFITDQQTISPYKGKPVMNASKQPVMNMTQYLKLHQILLASSRSLCLTVQRRLLYQ